MIIAATVGLPASRANVITSGDASTISQQPDGTWHMNGEIVGGTLYVGLNSNGSLLDAGSLLISPPHVPPNDNFPAASIGSAAGVTGIATVSAGTWSTSGLMEVGEFGTGSLSVIKAGAVTSYNLAVAGQIGSTGTLSVTGPGSNVMVTDNFLVGNQGNGTLTVDDHASVTTKFGVIAGNGAANATFSNQSSFTCNSSLIVAGANYGNLTIASGSTLTAPVIDLGVKTAPNENRSKPGGHLFIDASTVNCSGFLEIALDNFATDVVTVKDGSNVTAGQVDVGAGGTGTLVVGGDFSGRFGTPDNSGLVSTVNATTINIGGGQFDASGIQSGLYVVNGAIVTSGDSNVGGVDGFASVMGITAAGRSTWNAANVTDNTGDLGGGIAIGQGGLINSTTAIIDDGVAVVDGSSNGTPSTWKIVNTLYVGSTTGSQQYTLVVSDGALLHTGDAFLGDATNSSGTGANPVPEPAFPIATLTVVSFLLKRRRPLPPCPPVTHCR